MFSKSEINNVSSPWNDPLHTIVENIYNFVYWLLTAETPLHGLFTIRCTRITPVTIRLPWKFPFVSNTRSPEVASYIYKLIRWVDRACHGQRSVPDTLPLMPSCIWVWFGPVNPGNNLPPRGSQTPPARTYRCHLILVASQLLTGLSWLHQGSS